MNGMTKFLVVGHLTPTDADPDPDVQGKLDAGVTAAVADTRARAERLLLWWQDGIVVPFPAAVWA